MLIATATMDSFRGIPQHWTDTAAKDGRHIWGVHRNWPENIGVAGAYQAIYRNQTANGFVRSLGPKEPILTYLHDDVEIHEVGWDQRVEAEFADPAVAIVGFGGATGMGTPDLYKRPYQIEQLIRTGYASNQTDWQIHGERETGSRTVAVVDGFAMAIRRTFLDQIGGWSWMKTDFHCYDTAMCLMARRHGWKVRMVGVHCTHHGGGTSTKSAYIDWLAARGKTAAQDHQEPHVWLYEEFRDVLPWRV